MEESHGRVPGFMASWLRRQHTVVYTKPPKRYWFKMIRSVIR